MPDSANSAGVLNGTVGYVTSVGTKTGTFGLNGVVGIMPYGPPCATNCGDVAANAKQPIAIAAVTTVECVMMPPGVRLLVDMGSSSKRLLKYSLVDFFRPLPQTTYAKIQWLL